MEDIALKLSFIAAAGILSQWLAWRLHLPAIVLLLITGFLAGPLTGYIDPERDFGDIYRPAVSLAVAIILFEGGLTLNFKEIKETSKGVRRIIFVAGPIVWLLTTLAAHYIGKLSWPTASVLGAIMIVTGPTVIMPLLRQAQLSSRTASLLRWEAIVNDAIGALCAVIAFEIFLVYQQAHEFEGLALRFVFALIVAILGGYLIGRATIWVFIRGFVPEYLKAPVLFATVLISCTATNLILEEAGLLTVTVYGITLANSRIASLGEMRRFKETVTVLLVSSLFIILTAALERSTITNLDWQAFGFVFAVMFIIRPIAIFLATIGTGITFKERLLVSWIAPRGIVAVAVSGLFGAVMVKYGALDANRMVAFTFAVVVCTIIAHGFSLAPLAKFLKLKSSARPGILLVGGSPFTLALAQKLNDLEIPTLIADGEWSRIRKARLAGIHVYYGEVLSEEAHHHLDLKRFSTVIAATANDAYNTLICTDFGPEVGRSNVFQLATAQSRDDRQAMNFTLGGRVLTREPQLRYFDFLYHLSQGWTFQATRLTSEFSFEDYLANRPNGARIILWRKPSGALVFPSSQESIVPASDDMIVSFTPAIKDHANQREIKKTKSAPQT